MMLLSEICYLKGYIKGYQLGKTEYAKNIALSLYEHDMPIAKIAYAVGVSEEQVCSWLDNAKTQEDI